MEKIPVSQDELYTFLKGCYFIKAALAKRMGVSESILGGCFRHVLNRHGKPLSFSKANIERLNAALQQIAEELIDSKLKCSDEAGSATKRFVNDDPAIIESMRRIGEYIKLNRLTEKVLGWGKKKCDRNINLKDPNPHVHISREEIDRINAEILSIASTLAKCEVVAADGDTKPAERQTATKEKGTRTRMEQTFESKAYPWDNTDLSLQERSRLLHEQWPEGLLLYRVNNGYTSEGDDAIYINKVDESLAPFREPSSGMVTLWMDADTMERLLPRFVVDGRRVAITDMYNE